MVGSHEIGNYKVLQHKVIRFSNTQQKIQKGGKNHPKHLKIRNCLKSHALQMKITNCFQFISFSFSSGDVLSGVCFVGQLDSYSLGVFLLWPLCIYLVLGTIFLVAGFTSLFHIRTVMKGDGKRTDKLERLMIRIGFFSGLFLLPAFGFLGCLFYEYYNFDAWMLQWNQDMCIIFSIPCPFNSRYHEHEARPMFVVFMIKYVCSMLVGVTSSVWLYSGKTVVSWRRFIERIQGTSNANNMNGMGNGANLGALGNGITLGTAGNGTTTAANSKSGTANLVRTRGQAYV